MSDSKLQTARDAKFSLQPPPEKFERGRKVRVTQALGARRRKQTVLGAVFILLLAAGWVYPLIGYFIPACMLLGIGMAAFWGRSWCNWLCPRGSFEDAWLARISRGVRIPQVCRSTHLRLGVMAFLMGMLTWQIIRLWPDPWAIGGFFVVMLSATTVVGVILGIVFQQRTWCYLCPIGTMSNWVGKNRRPLCMASEKCAGCRLCLDNCPMQLSPVELTLHSAMDNRGDCLKCSICVASCPKGALAFLPSPGDVAAA